ncbi:MAG: type II CAAX endopeptidase family protein [Sulfurimonas sp.]
MTIRSVLPYLAITFVLAWGLITLLMLFPQHITAVFGEISASNPLFILAVYAPAIAAFILVFQHGGAQGLRRYLSRLLLWKVHWGWYVYLFFGIPFLFYAGAAIKGNLFTDPFPFSTWHEVFWALSFMLILGPIEEFGWRGVALPLLQQYFTPIWAGLILGIIWGIWHLPAFYLSGSLQSTWSFFPFFIGTIALSIIVTPLFNASGGSILLPLLFHWQVINPLFPDAAPYDTIMFVAAAIIIIIINRKKMFNKDSAVTEVIPVETVR